MPLNFLSNGFFNIFQNNFSLINNQASMDSVVDFSQGFSATHFEVLGLIKLLGFDSNFLFSFVTAVAKLVNYW